MVLTFRCRPGPSTCQGVAANVVDIQDSKCEGRVNVTREGSVSEATAVSTRAADVSVYQGTRESAWIGRGSPWFEPTNRTDNRKGCRYGRRRTSCATARAVVPVVRARDKKGGGSSLAAILVPRNSLARSPRDKTRLIFLAVKRSGERLAERFGRTKVRTSACPFFAILKQPM